MAEVRVRPLAVLFALVLALALGLSACGGGGGGDGSDEDQIVDAIETALTKTDPADCKELMTQAFMEQTLALTGAAAVEACEQNARAEESEKDPVTVAAVAVDGPRATAETTLSSGTLSGQTLVIALVDEDGWKLDEIVRFAKIDKGKLVGEIMDGFERGESPAEPRVSDCIRETLEGLPRPRLEEALVGGSSQPLVEISTGCQQ